MNDYKFLMDLKGIFSVTGRLRLAGDCINSSTASIPDPSKCSGIMISEYVDRIVMIANLMEKYKKLIEKDLEDMENVAKAVKNMDLMTKLLMENIM